MSAANAKTFPVFQISMFEDANSFVKCWSRLYNYPDYEKYRCLVEKVEFSQGDIRSLLNGRMG